MRARRSAPKGDGFLAVAESAQQSDRYGIKAAQIHKAGALELRPVMRIQTPEPTIPAEIA
jgi:hypothetical protein